MNNIYFYVCILQGLCATDACIAVCVERVNAVWLLHHLVQPFIEGGSKQTKRIQCME
jgi:hypothetical protein